LYEGVIGGLSHVGGGGDEGLFPLDLAVDRGNKVVAVHDEKKAKRRRLTTGGKGRGLLGRAQRAGKAGNQVKSNQNHPREKATEERSRQVDRIDLGGGGEEEGRENKKGRRGAFVDRCRKRKREETEGGMEEEDGVGVGVGEWEEGKRISLTTGSVTVFKVE
jgi:hypothetical protein